MNSTAIDDNLVQLRQHVEALVAHNEIAALVQRLGACLDEGRFEDLRSIFVEDATAKTPGGLAQGLDALIAQAGRNHSPDDRIQHLISDALIDLDGDRATVRANLIVTFARRTDVPGSHFSLGEVYYFDALRTPDGWRLARVESNPVWTSGTPIVIAST
jgi:hypothetical protein